MNFEKALDLMSQGKHVKSEVSKTIYNMEMAGNGKLFAEGIEVNANYLTKEEMVGEWIEMGKIIETKEEFDKLTDEQIQNVLSDAFVKHKFDIKNRGKRRLCKNIIEESM